MRLTTRDAAILMAVYRYRLMTTIQLQTLFFTAVARRGEADAYANPQGVTQASTRTSTRTHVAGDIATATRKELSSGMGNAKINTRCQYRLQLLYHHGYLMRHPQPQIPTEPRKPLVYSLDEKGAKVVQELLDGEEEFDWHPRQRAKGRASTNRQGLSLLFLDHLIATNDVRVAVSVAAKTCNFKVVTWLDELTLKRRHMADRDKVTISNPTNSYGRTQRVAVIPDGYFLLDTGAHLYSCFLEVDRATSTGSSSVWGRRDWARKVAAYLEYYRSGKYQERYRVQGLRVLTVTTTEKRLANLKAITERVGGKSRFWFTTLERVQCGDVLNSPIWQVASRQGFYKLLW